MRCSRAPTSTSRCSSTTTAEPRSRGRRRPARCRASRPLRGRSRLGEGLRGVREGYWTPDEGDEGRRGRRSTEPRDRGTTAVSKPVEQLDRVVIRFAGDSGDGMQLTGDRFTAETAAFGNDLSTLPNFPAEIRAPAGHPARRLGLPAPLRRPRHPDAGRRARRAGRDEPGGAQGQPRATCRAARTLIVNTDEFTKRNLAEGRLRRQPARGRLPRRLARPPGRADVA